MDEAFDKFIRKVEALPQSNVVFEKPLRELGLAGAKRERGKRGERRERGEGGREGKESLERGRRKRRWEGEGGYERKIVAGGKRVMLS